MRLVSKAFLSSLAALAASTATPALAQSGTSYNPPPVDYADGGAPAAALPAPFQPPAPAVTQSGVSYEPPAVDYVDPAQVSPPLPLQAQDGGQEPLLPSGPSGQPQRRRIDVGGYVELNQGVSAELGGGDNALRDDEILTYTSVAAGVEGQIETRRVAASFGYRYERRLELTGDVPDRDVHSGIAQVQAQIAPGVLAVEAGGIASRTGGTGRAFGVTNREPGAQVFAGYAGPTLSTHAGPVAINAFYRLGYVYVDDDSLTGAASRQGNFSSTIQAAGASISDAPGRMPFGWTVSAGLVSENNSLFDSHFQGSFVRGDALLPVNPYLALTGGIGYSRTRATERPYLRLTNGEPVIDADGSLVPNPNGPRVTAYDQEGVFADAGFIWRPSPRSELQLRAGVNDDGDPIVAGSAAFQVGRSFGFSFTLYDNDETFGQSLIRDLHGLPADFKIDHDPVNGSVTAGCVFSADHPGRGACISPALQAVTGVSYRARGGSLIFSGGRRLWSYGGGVTYAHRGYYLPDDPIFADAFAPRDQDLAVFGSIGRELSRNATLSFDAFVSIYDVDTPLLSDVTTIGGRASLSRSFLFDRLQLLLGVGFTYRSVSLDPDSAVADAILGLRYTF